MKNTFRITVLLLFLITEPAFPQQEKMSFGIFSGVNLSTNSYTYETGSNYLDTSYSNDVKTGFNLGMFAAYDFERNFSVKLQGQYTNKGGITDINTYSSTDLTYIERSYRNTINYLQFSLLPQLNLPFSKSSNESKAYFNAGGYLSVKLSASEKIENQTVYQYLDTERDISNSLTGTDAGLIFAGGIVYKGLLIDIRYDLGLTNIVDDPDFNDALDISNNSINFSIGWTGGF